MTGRSGFFGYIATGFSIDRHICFSCCRLFEGLLLLPLQLRVHLIVLLGTFIICC